MDKGFLEPAPQKDQVLLEFHLFFVGQTFRFAFVNRRAPLFLLQIRSTGSQTQG